MNHHLKRLVPQEVQTWMPLRNLLTVLPMMSLLLQLQQVPAVPDVVATDAVFPSAQSTVMKLETTTVTVAPITDGSDSIVRVDFEMSGMDLDLVSQGKSTGSDFFDLEAPEGDASQVLDESGLAFSDCASESPLDPDRAAFLSASAILEELQGFDVETFHGHLDRAWHALEPPQPFQFPWEVGMGNEIFGTCDGASTVVEPKLVRPAMVVLPDPAPWPPTVEKFRRLCTTPSFWQQVVLSSEVATWQEMHDAKLDIALKHWWDVIVMFPPSFQLVFQLSTMTSVAEQIAMMRDVIESRSPLTLLKRVDSITRYMTFLRSKAIIAPGVEFDFYSFLYESVRFKEPVIGWHGLVDLLSKRSLGAGKLPTAGPQQGVTAENWVAEWSSVRPMREAPLSDGFPGFRLFQHSKSRMLRLMDEERSKIFQRGRAAGAKHEAPPSGRLRLVVSKPDSNGAGSAADKVA